MVGVSHKTAPVEWRERLAVPEPKLPVLFQNLKDGGGATEAVILSTCNRVEIYAATPDAMGSRESIRKELASVQGDPSLASCLYSQEDEDAVRHLFHVASGLDSLVVGESEILGQVKRAYEAAFVAQATGKLTNVIFQRALYVGKLVRTRTRISEGPTSAASLAVALAERIFGNLKECRVLILGAGEMAETAADSFLSQKVARLTVVNRTLEKAQELARRFQGEAAPYDRLQAELAKADVVLCSTGAPDYVLKRAEVAGVMHQRREKPLFLIDISVPRNIEPAVHHLENVYLYNIDDLQSLVDENRARRQSEVDKAVALVDEKTQEFHVWYDAWRRGETATLRHAKGEDASTFSADAAPEKP
ncbi:MAG: glutamyl-tRNA reductase [Elusimicrobia bacterium]|nr:glutamyl-tRNA reductase [Elusimicrobiota bacterium]